MRTVFREDHEQFRHQAERFIAEHIAPHYDTWERDGRVPTSLWRRAGEAGLLNCALPEPFGAGGDFGHAAVVIEALAHANFLGVGFSIHSDMVAPYLYTYGTAEQRLRWLPAMARGEHIGAIAMSEPGAGSDMKAMQSRARIEADGSYRLSGQKSFITNGANATLFVVAASTAPDLGARGISLFCVPADAPGLSKGPILSKLGQHAQDTCEVFFDDVRLPADSLLGELNAGFVYLTRELAQERLAIALRAAASMDGMIGEAVAYTQQRKVFGRSVFDYQHTRFKLADARAQGTMLRVFLDDCLDKHMRGALDPVTAAMAKLNATEMQGRVLDDLLQMYGGYGYMTDQGIGRAWADARAMRIYGGTSEIMREIIGRAAAAPQRR